MKNTIENRQRFFAQYFGQNVANIQHPFDEDYMGEVEGLFIGGINYVELKPLTSITNDELGNIARFYEQTATNVYIDNDQLTFDYYSADETHNVAVELNSGYCLDYLRNNGFAMEWMGLSVEKQIEFGWVKLEN